MTSREKTPPPERLLTLSEAAAILSTSERFPRRLIEERRIRFVRIGRHVRIPDSALAEFIAAGVVEPIITTSKRRAALWATVRAVAGASALSENSNPASGRRVIAARTV
ncbi:MAG: excisionase family DNA-binding protein [Streptosporangiaceae bacterium]|jgi:excisionase family DNA binding protein